MVQKLEAKPLQLPIESSWTNFLMNLVWPVIGPEFSAAMKEPVGALNPALRLGRGHYRSKASQQETGQHKLSFLAPITVEVDLGTVPPEFGEVEVLEDPAWLFSDAIDTEMGSFMDLKLQLGCTFYFGFHNKAFMHARDVLGTDLAMDDPYLGMDFTHGWLIVHHPFIELGLRTGLDSRFDAGLQVEDAIVGAVNGTFGPWMVLPQRVVMPMRDSYLAMTMVIVVMLMMARNPMPKGCLKLTVKGAHGLVGTEWKPSGWILGLWVGGPQLVLLRHSLGLGVCGEVIDALHLDWKVRGVIDFSVGGLTVGVASEGDEMARKLGVRLSSSPGFQGLGFRVQARDAFAVSFFSLPWHRILCRNTV
ncbi:unnamed protein product [Symbiodinium microadriaticum]|nr:unnamed protein product [Symbiodinium microadriaticum]